MRRVSVLADGVPVLACQIRAGDVAGRSVLPHGGMRNHALPEGHAVDPVRPGVREPHAVAERDARIRVRPSSADSRRDSAADSSVSVPTVVSAIEMRAIGL